MSPLLLLEAPLPEPGGERGESVVARITVARDSPETDMSTNDNT